MIDSRSDATRARRIARRVLIAGVSLGVAANVGGWLLAWTARENVAHAAFVKLFELGVVALAVAASAGVILFVARRRWPPLVKVLAGSALGVVAGVAAGACAAYWPWLVVYGIFPRSAWSVP